MRRLAKLLRLDQQSRERRRKRALYRALNDDAGHVPRGHVIAGGSVTDSVGERQAEDEQRSDIR